ncbi:hypothetical protein [Nitratifractor sp.]
MAEIDEIKEILNTLRVWMSLTIGMIVVTGGGLVKRYDAGKEDWIFWAGALLLLLLLIALFQIIRKISEKTKEIKDL